MRETRGSRLRPAMCGPAQDEDAGSDGAVGRGRRSRSPPPPLSCARLRSRAASGAASVSPVASSPRRYISPPLFGGRSGHTPLPLRDDASRRLGPRRRRPRRRARCTAAGLPRRRL